MRFLLLVLLVTASSIFGIAYAQPLENITTTLEPENSNVSVHLAWNHEGTVSSYQIGCISCMPNFSNSTIHDEMTLHDITPLTNGVAFLYVIAYDNEKEIITAKQVIVKLS